VFPGQGPQWAGMAVELLDAAAVFAEELQRCEEALSAFLDWSPRAVLRGDAGAPSMDAIDVLQPLLFAVMVSLAALWRSCGVEPSAVVGHSQGEIAAAYVAGGLSLQDAARVVALRSRLLARLAGHGSIASVALSLAEVEARLARWEGRLTIASVNAPASIGVAGDSEAVAALVSELKAEGVRAQEIASTVASHSANVEDLRPEALELLSPVEPRSCGLPFYSTVTVGPLDTARLDGEYWYKNMRRPVRFEEVTRKLLREGFGAFVEVSPHSVLGMALQETADDEPDLADDAIVVGSLRRDDGSLRDFSSSLAELWVAGVAVDWSAALGARTEQSRVRLPTYAFQRERYWLEDSLDAVGALGVAGQESTGHPLLAAMVSLADSDGLLFTGRLALSAQPWLADHVLLGSVLLSAAGFIELALQAGACAGCNAVQELTLQEPLVVPASGAVQLQVAVGEAADDGCRTISIHARAEAQNKELPQAPWTCHASGVLARDAPAASGPSSGDHGEDPRESAWPPPGSEPADVHELYDELAEAGLDYGSSFGALRALWRRGEDVFADIGVSEEKTAEAARFGLHPALLEPALHAMALGSADAPGSTDDLGAAAPRAPRMPCAWRDVSLGAAGASRLRVSISPTGEDVVSLRAVDEHGQEVFGGTLALREVTVAHIAAARARTGHRSMFSLGWREIDPAPSASLPRMAFLESVEGPLARRLREVRDDVDLAVHCDLVALAAARTALADGPRSTAGGAAVLLDLRHDECRSPDVAADAHAVAREVFELVQAWLADERFGGDRLVIVTHGAIAAGEDDHCDDLAGATAWGLVRSAQLESLGRMMLIDVDDEEASLLKLPEILGGDELQIVLRAGRALVPRMHPAESPAAPAPFDPDRTTLITGGTGGLGALLARHLVAKHGARSLILVSRSGADAKGAGELRQELEGFGARVALVACDVADRDQLLAALAAAPSEAPVGAVIHTAGVSEDGVIESLTVHSIDTVLRPKVDGAWHLHELTAGLNLTAFVLYSSLAGVVGNPGAANYGAANAFLDALAAHRRERGLPGTSIAWGLWQQSSGMREKLSDAQLARMGRMGVNALSAEEGLALFDLAYSGPKPLAIALRLDFAALRQQARDGVLLPLMSELARTSPHRAPEGSGGPLFTRLAGVGAHEREAVVGDFLREQIAAVLGHTVAEEIDTDMTFKELGFDSLGVVLLRNRLNAATRLQLPTTLVFSYPTPAALANHLHAQLAPSVTSGVSVEDGVRQIEQSLSSAEIDDDDRTRVASRLRALAVELEAAGREDGVRQDNTSAVVDRIESASATELFEFFEQEFT
jgi:malonyl CoA-acyl carrier protein transacylase/short-subunit dehydrogenase/acyl carrier protein